MMANVIIYAPWRFQFAIACESNALPLTGGAEREDILEAIGGSMVSPHPHLWIQVILDTRH